MEKGYVSEGEGKGKGSVGCLGMECEGIYRFSCSMCILISIDIFANMSVFNIISKLHKANKNINNML